MLCRILLDMSISAVRVDGFDEDNGAWTHLEDRDVILEPCHPEVSIERCDLAGNNERMNKAMSNNQTKESKIYGVDVVFPMEFEMLREKLAVDWDDEFPPRDGEAYCARGAVGNYIGEGYNKGERFVRHGNGSEYWSNGSVKYIGEFKHDTASGKGKAFSEYEDLLYEGEFWLNRWHGKGKSYRENGALHYEGTFFEGLFDGDGRAYHENGKLSYEGEVKDGVIHGYGRKYNEDGNIYYEGRANMGEPDGYGRLYHPNGRLRYEGEIKKLQFWGYGRKYLGNGQLEYEGEFVNGDYSGQGRYYVYGKLEYEGEFVDGAYCGQGRFYVDGKLEYEGEFVDGAYCGQGRLYDPHTGKLIREGVFHEVGGENVKTEDKWESVIEVEEDEGDEFTGSLPRFEELEEKGGV